MLRPAPTVTFYQAVRVGHFVQFCCSLHEKVLGAGFRSHVIRVARDFLLSSIYGDGGATLVAGTFLIHQTPSFLLRFPSSRVGVPWRQGEIFSERGGRGE